MGKKLGSLIALILLVVVVPGVSAQEETMMMQQTTTQPVVSISPRQPMVTRPVMQPKRFQAEIKEKRFEAKQSVSSREASMTTRPLIQNAQKKAAMQNIDSKLLSVNDSVTIKWATALDEFESMTMRASSEAAGLKAAGIQTVNLDAALTRAEFAIDTAKTAVMTQAGKSYAINATSEAGLRTAGMNSMSQMRNDLRVTHTSVLSAKTAVKSAMSALVNTKRSLLNTTPVATGGAVIGE
jgi:hypothetical protein